MQERGLFLSGGAQWSTESRARPVQSAVQWLTIGDGVRIADAPELGEGQLKLVADRALEAGSRMYCEGLLATRASLLGTEAYITHLCSISLHSPYVICGVQAREQPEDMGREAFVCALNVQGRGMSGLSFANSDLKPNMARCFDSLCCAATQGGALYAVRGGVGRVLEDIVLCRLLRDVQQGEELLWDYPCT